MKIQGSSSAGVAVMKGFHGQEGGAHEARDPFCQRRASLQAGGRCKCELVAADGVEARYIEGEKDYFEPAFAA